MFNMMMKGYVPDGSFGWNSSVGALGGGFAAGMTFGIVILAALIWTLYWKFHAIWKAVKHEQKIWVVVFLLVNTLGILEILYIYFFSKYKKSS